MTTEKDQNKVAGALARAKSLTPEERSQIARKAALVRHGKELPKAIAEGILQIGDLKLTCAVLDDSSNTRVLTQEGFLMAIGRAGKAKGGEEHLSTGNQHFCAQRTWNPLFPMSYLGRRLLLSSSLKRGLGIKAVHSVIAQAYCQIFVGSTKRP